MQIEISKKYTGLSRDVFYNLDNKSVVTNSSEYSISFNDINNFLLNKKFKILEKEYYNIINLLNINTEKSIKWNYLLPNNILKDKFNLIIKNISSIDDNDKKYIGVIKERYEFTRKIKNAYIDGKKTDIPIYDHCSTITGRAVIRKGYNFLTSKKKDRYKIESNYRMGEIYEIDIKSLEPRILMHLNGHSYVEDIYDHFKNILNITAERKKIKLAVISIMYGSSIRNAESLTGVKRSDLKKIYEYLKIEEWKKKLERQREDLGFIVNPYGKKIYKDGPLVNYFFQSTGADCSCLAFNKLVERYDSNNFKLLASIHDAIIVDYNNPEPLVKNLKNEKHIYCSILDIKLPVTVKRIKNEKESN